MPFHKKSIFLICEVIPALFFTMVTKKCLTVRDYVLIFQSGQTLSSLLFPANFLFLCEIYHSL